jgi:DNA-binding transcriptional MerR regulator
MPKIELPTLSTAFAEQAAERVTGRQAERAADPVIDRVVLTPGDRGYLRIGAIARLAGIPQATLRAWETRYEAFKPLKSAGGQRLYLPEDATRATLIRVLSRLGHSLAVVASASLDTLLALKARHDREHHRSEPPAQKRRAISMLVCGETLAVRLIEALQGPEIVHSGLELTRVIAGFDEAQVLRFGHSSDLVAIELVSLHRAQSAAVARLLAELPQARFLVLYRFGPQTTVLELQALGVSVCREPLDHASLSLAISALIPTTDPIAQGARDHGLNSSHHAAELAAHTVSEPRFSLAVLQAIQAIEAKLPCECPRHVAELLAQLMAFERYSKECLGGTAITQSGVESEVGSGCVSAEDSLLHFRLWKVAATCRERMEDALRWVAEHEGIELASIGRRDIVRLASLRSG